MRIPGFIRRLFGARQIEPISEEEADFRFDCFLHDLFHLDEAEELIYLQGRSTPEETARIEAHLATCQQCRDEIANLRDLTNE